MRHQEHAAFLGFGISLSWFASTTCQHLLQHCILRCTSVFCLLTKIPFSMTQLTAAFNETSGSCCCHADLCGIRSRFFVLLLEATYLLPCAAAHW